MIQTPDPRIRWPAGYELQSARVFAQNRTQINASPERVWSLLVDCTRWPDWYKHCSDVSLNSGSQLNANSTFRFKTLGFYFEPEVMIFEPSHMLVWTAKGALGTYGAHAWLIEPIDGGCEVVTEEAQNGLLLTLLGSRPRNNLLEAHEDWLQSLKRLAEDDGL